MTIYLSWEIRNHMIHSLEEFSARKKKSIFPEAFTYFLLLSNKNYTNPDNSLCWLEEAQS